MSEKEKGGNLDFAWIRRIADAMEEHGAQELDVEIPDQGFKLYIRFSPSPLPQLSTEPLVQETQEDDPYEDKEKYEKVVSPLTGVFYRKPDPTSPPFVSEGDYVDDGQPLCMVEANKTFNRIDASVSGVIVRIMEDKSSVKNGDVLMIIDKTKGSPVPTYMR